MHLLIVAACYSFMAEWYVSLISIKEGVMTRPEKFSRYKTTAWRTNKVS